MREFLKRRFAKLVIFLLIGFIALGVASLSKVILGWMNYGEAARNNIGEKIGDYVGMGLVSLVVLVGSIAMGFQLVAELRSKRSQPPPIIAPRMPRRRR